MTDRELVELAAKAAGLRPAEAMWHPRAGCVWVKKVDGIRTENGWNPPTGGGGGLGVATGVYFTLGRYETYCSAGGSYAPNGYEVPSEIIVFLHETRGDRDAATRLAIVRTAAEIGKSMP